MKKPWTDVERDELRALWLDKTNKMSDICNKLSRSKFAVINEVRRLNVRRRAPRAVNIGGLDN